MGARVRPLWAVVAIGLLVLAAGWRIAPLVAELRAASRSARDLGEPPFATAELARADGELAVVIQGSPGAAALVIADGQPIRIVELDRRGRGAVVDPRIVEGSAIEIAALAEAPEPVPPLPIASPSSTPTAPSTPTPSPLPTETPPPARPLAATATPSPTGTPGPLAPTATAAGPRPRELNIEAPVDRSGSPPVLHLVGDAGPRIAITFDGNASSNGTVELLELLHELDLEITLFVTGGFVERYPTLVRRAVLAGHEVGNHTYSHPHLTTYGQNRRHDLLPTVTESMLQDQLRRTEEAFRRATGRPMAPLWRAPYGEENAALRSWAMDLGYLHVRWSSLKGASLDSLDWIEDEHSKLYRSSRRMVDRLLGFPRLEGGIVLMHLATERSEPPWSDLPRFVEELRRRRVEPVKISELLEASPTWRSWLERARERHDSTFGE
ncbi:MAG: polysaccharide deacetylase family protein [Thermoanaerobaculales bacterium]|jgi:peptidoglycan/xylan/chitin deacetylase (PgdA/CDA1 family)|nr:polysaccharide deacetylase family protein [Thermoanaerobaculales bacterium]